MADIQRFIIATAGHVDHGKSALIKALTGTDPDRLPEEKARGITIDLGFASLDLQSPIAPFTTFIAGIVDVPGHEDFVKNMVAGVGSIDLALLIVAADDGWMPQTEEHLQILDYLGVKRAVVALTKIDLAQDEAVSVASVREKLRGTPFPDAPIVATSIVVARGIAELKSALGSELARTPQPRDIGKPRLPIDRVFNLQGIGTVVTGTLTGGALRRGENIIVQPSGRPARIRSMQSHNRDVEVAHPGTRTALNLPNLAPNEDVRRGDVITLPAFAGVTETIDVLLRISQRATIPIKDGARVWVHHGTDSVAVRVFLFTNQTLGIGEQTLAQLRLETPASFFTGDRFVVRDWAEQHTLAGGVVLDADASTEQFRSATRSAFLAQRAKKPENVATYVTSQLERDGAASASQLLVRSRFSKNEISEAVSRLIAEGVFTSIGKCVADAAQWREFRQHAINAIDAHHRAHPEHLGLPLVELRKVLQNASRFWRNAEGSSNAMFEDIFAALMADLSCSGFVQLAAVIRRSTHRPVLPKRLQEAGERLRSTLAHKPFDPPSRKDLAPDPVSQEALRFLVEVGEAVEIDSELTMAAEGEKRATDLIRLYISKNGPATVSELRQAINSSRRVVVPLLERLDRRGVTVRLEDKRILRG